VLVKEGVAFLAIRDGLFKLVFQEEITLKCQAGKFEYD